MAHARGLNQVRSAREVFGLAKSGDERALEVVRDEAGRLAYLVAAVSAVLDPELVVLSGGVGTNIELLSEPLETALRRSTPLVPRIVAGELGDGAVLSGAIALGLKSARDLVFDRRKTITL